MKFQATYTLPVSRERLWELLLTPEELRQCLPGCERLTQVGPDTYEATLTIGAAAVRGTYTGRLRILDQDPPSRCRLLIEGTGSSGFVRGEAVVRLGEDPAGTTLAIDADAQVGGLIASVGQRMLAGVGRMLLGEFIKRVEAHLAR
ncbi:MAG: CoxG family protein [Candidatus Methylomirabilales bacterium]